MLRPELNKYLLRNKLLLTFFPRIKDLLESVTVVDLLTNETFYLVRIIIIIFYISKIQHFIQITEGSFYELLFPYILF